MSASSAGNPVAEPEPSPTPRRRFLRWLSGLGAAISAFLVGYPSIRAFFWPTRAPPSTDHWVRVVDDVALVDIGTPARIDYNAFDFRTTGLQPATGNHVFLGNDLRNYGARYLTVALSYRPGLLKRSRSTM